MPNPELTQFLIAQGGFAVSFLLIFMFYRKDVRSYTELWKAMSDQLMSVVKENTASNTRLIASNDSMQVLLAQLMKMVSETTRPQRFTDRRSVRMDDVEGEIGK